MLWNYALYRPSHLQCLLLGDGASRRPGSDAEHLRAAAAWLARAQDATPDGGVVGRYQLNGGWSSSYPETTGYIVPTFLALASALDPAFEGRAQRCVEFLLTLQLECGGFPAGEVAANRTEPSVFNSAQIVHGLLRWHLHSGDEASLRAARRAADWIVSLQEADGAWRRHAVGAQPATHMAHLSCWLAELGAYCADTRYLEAASRHLDWVMSHRDPVTGWFDRCDFDAEDHEARVATTHVIGYALSGVLVLGRTLERDDALAAVRLAGERLAHALERDGWVSGVLDAEWQPRAASACLTGNAQIALFLLDLHAQQADERLLQVAVHAIDLVKRSQLVHVRAPDLSGAIPGSAPIWGSYIRGACPNWAAKFFIDALLRKGEALSGARTSGT